MFYPGLIESGFTVDDVVKLILTDVFGLHVLPFLGLNEHSVRGGY